jgi:hypothetical protein
MCELQLYGMKAAFDEIMATAVKRQHEPQRIIGDLLTAEISEKQARSIKYQLSIAKLPLAKDLNDFQFEGTPINETLMRDLAGGTFLAQQRNAVSVGGPAVAKLILRSPSLVTAFDPAPVAGSTTWWISSIASKSKPAIRSGYPRLRRRASVGYFAGGVRHRNSGARHRSGLAGRRTAICDWARRTADQGENAIKTSQSYRPKSATS